MIRGIVAGPAHGTSMGGVGEGRVVVLSEIHHTCPGGSFGRYCGKVVCAVGAGEATAVRVERRLDKRGRRPVEGREAAGSDGTVAMMHACRGRVLAYHGSRPGSLRCSCK